MFTKQPKVPRKLHVIPGNWWMGLTDETVEGEWLYYDTNTVVEFTGQYCK